MEDDGPIQGIFDFDTGHPDGLANWRRQEEERLNAVREVWALPVGRRVRIRLRDIDGEFVGLLKLLRYPTVLNRRLPLQLRVGTVDVAVEDIEVCSVVGDPSHSV
jgi:hypothetical protein